MKTLEEVRTLLAAHQEALRQRFGVRVVGIFGSYARGEVSPVSGVDLLLKLERPVCSEIGGVKKHLKALLGLRVDIVTRGAHCGRLQKRILSTQGHSFTGTKAWGPNGRRTGTSRPNVDSAHFRWASWSHR